MLSFLLHYSTIISQAHTLAKSLAPYREDDLLKEYYLPLLNLGGTSLLPLAIEMFDQLKKETTSAAMTVFKKENNRAGNNRCVSTHCTIYISITKAVTKQQISDYVLINTCSYLVS